MDHEFADFYQLDELYTQEEREIRDKVRDFVDRECLPHMARYFDEGAFPMEVLPRMVEMGLFGVHVDGYGCRKANETTYGLVCQELGRGDSGLRAMFSVQNSLVMYPIFSFGSEEQKEAWLPKMAAADVIGCFGLSEPGFGSNPGGMATRAEKKGDVYVLNGSKMWITNGTIAGLAVIWAKLEGRVNGFLVPTDTEGFKASPIRHKFAYRTSPTALITLKDVAVPETSRLPHTQGLKSVFQCLNHARFGVAGGATGSALACLEAARNFALKREVFDRPIASYQLIQQQLADILTLVAKAQLLCYRLGRLLDEGRAKPAHISLAKRDNVASAMQAARIARDILGARGILADHQVIRHLCDLEAVSTLEGTGNMHALVLGQELTGIQAFR